MRIRSSREFGSGLLGSRNRSSFLKIEENASLGNEKGSFVLKMEVWFVI